MKEYLSRNKKILCPLLAFLIPIVIMTGISVISDFFPYGKFSILMADMRYQFVDYYANMKNIAFGNDTILYSFNKTFAGDISGLLAYYCNNPFLIFLLLVPNKYLPGGILIMMTVMLGFIGLSFNIFISNMYEKRYLTLIFSTAYAFIGYLMGYFNCTLYYFDVMMLPLVMLGVYFIIKNKKVSILYIISIALSIFSSYYIGYMICLFSICFFLYLYLCEINSIKEIKNHFKPVIIYVLTSVLGVALSSISLLCAIFSLSGQQRGGLSLSLSTLFNVFEIFQGFYVGSFQGNVTDGLPLIYCGQLAVIFLILFYLNKKVTIKEKILSCIVLIVLILSFLIDAFNVLWHGFSHPIGFPYRNSFLFSFFVLFLSYKSFLLFDAKLQKKKFIFVSVIFVIYSCFMILVHNETVGLRQIAVTGLFVAAIIIIVCIKDSKKLYPFTYIALLVVSTIEVSYNAYVSINSYFPWKEEDETITMDYFSSFIDETSSIVDYIQNIDKSLYRIEKLYRRSNNDSMMFGYKGLSHFSSCEIDKTKRFLGSLGFRDNDNWAFYGEGSTIFADCLMSVKYIISQYNENKGLFDTFYEYNNKYVYINPYTLGFMFGSTDEILNVNKDKEDHFTYQNKVAGSIIGKDVNIYTPVDEVKVKLTNVEKEGTKYKKIDKNKAAYIDFDFKANKFDFIYMFFNAPKNQDVSININGEDKQPYFTNYGWSIRELGHFFIGSDINLRMTLKQDEIELDSYEFYYESLQAIESWHDYAATNKYELNEISSSHLIGECEVDENVDRLVFTIPCERDWKVYIDGERVEIEEVLDCLMSVKITPGKHTIEMKYMPKGVILGIPITFFALMIFIMLFKSTNHVKIMKI